MSRPALTIRFPGIMILLRRVTEPDYESPRKCVDKWSEVSSIHESMTGSIERIWVCICHLVTSQSSDEADAQL
jgi:hypothetical protein